MVPALFIHMLILSVYVEQFVRVYMLCAWHLQCLSFRCSLTLLFPVYPSSSGVGTQSRRCNSSSNSRPLRWMAEYEPRGHIWRTPLTISYRAARLTCTSGAAQDRRHIAKNMNGPEKCSRLDGRPRKNICALALKGTG